MKTIAPSELIITPKGTIYHLDLAPEQLANTVITVGDPGRVSLVSQYFDQIEHRSQHREFVAHTGYIGKKRITVVSTGIGPDNIDIALTEIDALANIDFNTRCPKEQIVSLNIIRLGTSGALQAAIPVDSFVASTYGIGLDNMMHYYATEPNPDERLILNEFKAHTHLEKSVIAPYVFESSIKLLNYFDAPFLKGITVTCPGFYGPQGRVLRAGIAFPHLINALSTFECRGKKITNFEMETAAIYGLGKLLGHQCLSLNTIVANRVNQTFSTQAEQAIDKMIQLSLEIIEKIPT